MSNLSCLPRLFIVAGLLASTACGGKGKSQGMGGVGGGSAGRGGASGSGGVAPIVSCPASMPSTTIACEGAFTCPFEAFCNCHGCCSAYWSCVTGRFNQTDFNDGCLQGPPCADGGAGTSGGGGAGGTSGGTGGTGGAPIASCPASRPVAGAACSGTFTCNYNDLCRCGICCFSSYRCNGGGIEFLGASDGCMQINCDGGVVPDAYAPPVCTPGADPSCNDNPAWSSIHGRCTDAGTCVCGDSGTNPDSGRCL